jgi:hypothetical protein
MFIRNVGNDSLEVVSALMFLSFVKGALHWRAQSQLADEFLAVRRSASSCCAHALVNVSAAANGS